MPIGKNAIKRVEGNGYSKVQTSAPDMEHSHVIASPDEQVVENMVAPVEKKTAKKAPAKRTAAKKTAPKKAPVENESKDKFVRTSVGEDMPYWLM